MKVTMILPENQLFNFNRLTLSTFCVEFLISDEVNFDLFQPQTFAIVICVHISNEHLPLSSKQPDPEYAEWNPEGSDRVFYDPAAHAEKSLIVRQIPTNMKKSERKNWYKEEDERLQRLRKEAEEKKLESKDGKTILGVILIF
jgi:hypothetical protein